MDFMKPGDKAIVYLNPYHLQVSRIYSWHYDDGDEIWLPEDYIFNQDTFYKKAHSLPKGLRFRTESEQKEIVSHPVLEALNGGYELLDTFMSPWGVERFEEALDRLDRGEAQILVTYANMLPKYLSNFGLPTPTLLDRTRKNGWRVALIQLYADPKKSSMFWKSEYTHLVKDEISDGVLVRITE